MKIQLDFLRYVIGCLAKGSDEAQAASNQNALMRRRSHSNQTKLLFNLIQALLSRNSLRYYEYEAFCPSGAQRLPPTLEGRALSHQ